MSEQTNGRLGDLTFHIGIDYACVMGEHQTTEAPIARLFGISKDVESYGKLFAAAHDLLEAALLLEAAEENRRDDCEECGGEGEPEACGICFPPFDDARIKRRLAIAKATGSTP